MEFFQQIEALKIIQSAITSGSVRLQRQDDSVEFPEAAARRDALYFVTLYNGLLGLDQLASQQILPEQQTASDEMVTRPPLAAEAPSMRPEPGPAQSVETPAPPVMPAAIEDEPAKAQEPLAQTQVSGTDYRQYIPESARKYIRN